jgi:hypothetical protein
MGVSQTLLPWLVWNLDSSDVSLASSYDYSLEPLATGAFFKKSGNY